MKYSKLLRAISDSNRHYATSKGMQDKISSIYEENPSDPKSDIPANKFMFETVIRDAFDVYDSSDEEADEKDFLSQREWLDRVMGIFEDKNPIKAGRIFCPSQSKMNKLGCIDQAKIMIKKNQIAVA
mmetsp:Transcript_2165/g.2999  ORF Transcript_2165/g.2999 Transcript_2165/m.2999 type:complete len:127 (+) Transcript_2165:149-529(+)|eukprot:CAMPEP_0185574854 /NCGR_PEP_ID=MMETSP0434-20130131/6210_1 /TAXON_ID=626734 ORGANISM="Favella taraikaensis, Strain Fe Narragansett Bay" /NCGR_SAMPLE_ID=MMETSP0434 /ASSEMBLY_ACC=CAM_ASM_000379 /LENGTH=126 /DNA_ID=CAMNT_0028191559 /DNA_START=139 /DNA_END=519 /DNA_ORIENTATION=+